MIDVKDARDPRTVKQQEYAAAKVEEQAALLEYVAVMADVELPESDGEVSTDE